MTTLRCPHCSTLVACDAELPVDVICLACERRFRAEQWITPLAVPLPPDTTGQLQLIESRLAKIEYHAGCIGQMLLIALVFSLLGALTSIPR